MSKSLGNFIILHELLDKGIQGETIRLAFLMSKYNEPMDWNEKLVSDAKKLLDKGYRTLKNATGGTQAESVNEAFLAALNDDLNTPKALSILQTEMMDDAAQLVAAGAILGIFQHDAEQWFKQGSAASTLSDEAIEIEIQRRKEAKQNKDFTTADAVRDTLKAQGIILEDRPDGSTDWRRE